MKDLLPAMVEVKDTQGNVVM